MTVVCLVPGYTQPIRLCQAMRGKCLTWAATKLMRLCGLQPAVFPQHIFVDSASV